ncbi:uncharacterized protein [Euphorbia lathyris]|uniref:uncharacterized protein n=1 Tax=Euphorbia lathyris TaxID=212925 RepID=UPI003313E71A
MTALGIAHFQYWRSLPIITPSLFPRSPVYGIRPRKLSTSITSPLCFTSNNTQISENGDRSIVGDFLDYLNESWTQFHATGDEFIKLKMKKWR